MGARSTRGPAGGAGASATRRKSAAAAGKTAPARVRDAAAGRSAPKHPSDIPKSSRKGAREQPYHHGDLRDALLQAATRIAARDGLQGLTLRAVAREAGVSHAAPAHHFGDVTGLISELAAIAFRRFSAALSEAAASASSPDEAAEGRARAYVGFARDNPCLFQLMFRTERLDHSRPALREAAENAFLNLAKVVGARRHETVTPENLTLAQAADIARMWSMVHGFAMLYLDGRLRDILDGLPPGTTAEALLAAMLRPDRVP
jgi:AcrR family transcriptional regulator